MGAPQMWHAGFAALMVARMRAWCAVLRWLLLTGLPSRVVHNWVGSAWLRGWAVLTGGLTPGILRLCTSHLAAVGALGACGQGLDATVSDDGGGDADE